MNPPASEYRFDPLQRRWVIIASERGRRPQEFGAPPAPATELACPFCPGHEDKTPPAILTVPPRPGSRAGAQWLIRVVPNKFPALRVEGQPQRKADGIFDAMAGIGAHEVIIECPEHDSSLCERSVEDLAALLQVYRERIHDLMRDIRLRYILVFKNHGAVAGASLQHPHSQIMATAITPKTVEIELSACQDHFDQKERCLVCDMIQQEANERHRLVTIDDRFIAFTPYAARFPFEVFLAPRFHSHDVTHASGEDLRALARILQDVLRRLKRALDDPPYNFVLHTCPNPSAPSRRAPYWRDLEQAYHWHIEILPRLTRVAGFEWGTGFYINPTPPEESARYLREV